jgi:hypothetical protein
MALPIRDGNQSPTTLSTIIISNAHVPAHTVVSLGTQAITDIATAVSGVELGPNTLNALENITVTLGQVTITGGLTDAQLRASAVTIGGGVYLLDAQSVIGSSIPPEVIQIGGKNLADSKLYPISVDSNGVQSISGVVTASISGTPSVTFGTAVITGSTSILNFPATQTVTFTQASVTFGTSVVTGSVSVLNIPATQTVTFSEAPVTFGLIFGTVTANPTGTQTIVGSVTIGAGTEQIGSVTASINGTVAVSGTFFQATQPVSLTTLPALVAGTAQIGSVTASISNSVTIASLPAISGTVTANIGLNVAQSLIGGVSETNPPAAVRIGWCSEENFNGVGVDNGGLPLPIQIHLGNSSADNVTTANPLPISGTVTVGNSVTIAGSVTIGSALPAGTNQIGSVTASISGTIPISISSVTVGNSVTIASLPAISGTVTAGNLPIYLKDDVLADENIVGTVVFDISGRNSFGVNGVTVGSIPSLPAGTNRIGVVTIGAGTVTIGAGTAQIGSVTASISGTVTANLGLIGGFSGGVELVSYSDDDSEYYQVAVPNAGNPYIPTRIVGGTVTIGSLPAISGTVTANLGNVAQSLIFATSSTIPTSAIRLGFADEEQFIGVGTDSYGNPLPIQIHLGNSAGDRVTTAKDRKSVV